MLIRVGLEYFIDGRSMAWALEHFGCFSYGKDRKEALETLPAAMVEYAAWMASHTAHSWLANEPAEIRLEETWDGYTINDDFERVTDGYDVDAWFLYDWKPLDEQDIQRGVQILAWSRADLLETVRGLSAEVLEHTYPGERWNITGILKHVGGAEWWYLERLGLAFPRAEVPTDAFERLNMVREHLNGLLPSLAGSRQVVGVDGEFWSPSKMLRRAAWHELDHVTHIRKLLGKASN